MGLQGSGKTHTMYQMVGGIPQLRTVHTPVMNNEVVKLKQHGIKFECWDPSGDPNYIQFWESVYKNVAFDIVIYVVDAQKYWKTDRAARIVEDRMELHTLLCAPELANCRFILYLNWKTSHELGEERNMLEAIPEELELYRFPQRDIITVDTYQTLLDTLINIQRQDEKAAEEARK